MSQNEQQIEIELTDGVAEGNYSNLTIVAHSQYEFIIDFASIMPGINKAKIKDRIIMTPQHAKKLMLNLIENIKQFEATNGTIKEKGQTPAPFAFSGQAGEA